MQIGTVWEKKQNKKQNRKREKESYWLKVNEKIKKLSPERQSYVVKMVLLIRDQAGSPPKVLISRPVLFLAVAESEHF